MQIQASPVSIRTLQIALRKRGVDVTAKALSMRASRGVIGLAPGKGKYSILHTEFKKILEMADCCYPRATAEKIVLASGTSERTFNLWLEKGKLPSVKKYGERWIFKPSVDRFAKKLANPTPFCSPQNARLLTTDEAIAELSAYGVHVSRHDIFGLMCEGGFPSKIGGSQTWLEQQSVDLIAKIYFNMRKRRESRESLEARRGEGFSSLVHEPLLDSI